MAVKVIVRTEAETQALDRYQKELDNLRAELIKSGKGLDEFNKEMRKLDSQQRTLNKLTGESTQQTSKLKNMFAGFTITAGDVWNALQSVGRAVWDVATAGAEAQKATDTLRFSVERAGVSWTANAAAIEANIQKVSWLAAVDDEELAVAQSKLIRSTGDLTESQKLLGLATDISAVTGTNLESVTKALSRAYNGNFGALTKLDIAVDTTKSKTEIMQQLYETFGGSAAYVNDNLVASSKRVEIAWGNMKEQAGAIFGPKLATDMDNMSLAMQLIGSETLTAGEKWSTYYDVFFKHGTASIETQNDMLMAALDLNGGLDQMTAAEYRAAAAAGELASAQEALSGAIDSTEQSSINLARAEMANQDAQAKLNKLIADGKTGTREYEDAVLDARQAELNLKEAKDRASDNQAQLDALKAEEERLAAAARQAERYLAARRAGVNPVGSGSLNPGLSRQAEGSILPATPGGIHVLAAEAGVDEAFIPLERTPRSLALLVEAARRIGAPVAQGASTSTNTTVVNFNAPVRTYTETLRAMRDIERGMSW